MAGVVYSATGKRKTSVARVRIMPGTGTVTVNGRAWSSTSAGVRSPSRPRPL